MRFLLLAAAFTLLASTSGCKRTEEPYDDRTLEKRPHVDTVKPVDRSDAFRP